MKRFKFSKRTKNIAIATAALAGATVINFVKDQSRKIVTLNEQVQKLYNKAFDSLNYELNLESFIVNRFGEEVLERINS